jgi:very-short-patch-repair endonuclease
MKTPLHHDRAQVLVSVPEFCFLQMASLLPIEKLIALGFELCGSYARSSQGTFFDTRPLTTPRKLVEFLSRATGFRGIKQAKRALQYILPYSASPMETALTMQLCLPYLLGGYGIPKPRLNRRINLPNKVKERSYSSFYVCDLYWEDDALAIEYDSNFAHAGINKTVKDAMRRSILTGIGISVLSVTWAQVLDREALDKIARIVARGTGKRLRCSDPSFRQRQQHLRSLILPLRTDQDALSN